MSNQRIKGQEVEVALVINNRAVTTVTAVRSFSFTFKQEIKEEGYLGETTNRYDSIFNGIEGELEFHQSEPDVFTTIQAIVDKARRRTPGVQINVKATLNFPVGTRRRVMIPNVEFGAIPVNFGSRADYGASTLSFGASEAQVLA